MTNPCRFGNPEHMNVFFKTADAIETVADNSTMQEPVLQGNKHSARWRDSADRRISPRCLPQVFAFDGMFSTQGTKQGINVVLRRGRNEDKDRLGAAHACGCDGRQPGNRDMKAAATAKVQVGAELARLPNSRAFLRRWRNRGFQDAHAGGLSRTTPQDSRSLLKPQRISRCPISIWAMFDPAGSCRATAATIWHSDLSGKGQRFLVNTDGCSRHAIHGPRVV